MVVKILETPTLGGGFPHWFEMLDRGRERRWVRKKTDNLQYLAVELLGHVTHLRSTNILPLFFLYLTERNRPLNKGGGFLGTLPA